MEKFITISESDTTRHQETLFAVGIGIHQIKGGLNREMLLNDGLFSDAFDRFVITDKNVTKDSVFLFANTFYSWSDSVVMGVNRLMNHSVVKSAGGKYTIHRGSKFVNDIYKSKSHLLTKEVVDLVNDKWNPADIWMSKIDGIPIFKNINELNKFISEGIKNGELLPVSLKKSFSPRIYIIEQGSVKNYKFSGIKKPQTPFNTGINILTSDPLLRINVRSFSISTNSHISNEIIISGSDARHGKAGVPPIAQKYGIKLSPVNYFKKNESNINGLISKVVDLWSKCGYTYTKSQIDQYWKQRSKELPNVVGYFMSITNSLEFGLSIKNSHLSDEIVTEIVKQASSKNDYSSNFVKVM